MKRSAAIFLALITVFCALPCFVLTTDSAFTGDDKINIVLDPGHGGSNIGASAKGIGEKAYTMQLAALIRDELLKNGSFNVYMTRTGDYDLELYERAEVANNYNADLLISLHFDGNPSPSVHGVTAYTSVFDSYAAVTLASSISSNISSSLGLSNNGVRRRADNAGYYWNSEKQWDCQDPSLGVLSDYYGIPTWCAKFGIRSIIVEHGYFSNSGDVSKVCAEGALPKIAKAEADAIIAYYTNHTHVYSAAKRDYPSNCVYTGKQSEHCSVCGHRRNVTSLSPDAANHYWVNKEYVAATCGKDGKAVKECRITQNLADKGWTGTLHNETSVLPAPYDHTFELVKEVAATHTVDGYKQWKCKTCTYSFKDILKAEGHSYEFAGYKEPTCTETGGNTYKCTGCTSSYTETEAAKGHSFTVTNKVDPTCTQSGKQDKICSVCGYETADIFDPLGHSLPESSIVEPTCTEDGYKRGNCLRCGEAIDETLQKTGHTLTVNSEVSPTCEKEGMITSVCSVCNYTEDKITEATGHTFESGITVKPTCEKAGETTLTCSVCSLVTTEKVEATGHKKSEKADVTKKATAFSEGTIEYTCENGCGKTFTEELSPSITGKTKMIIIAISAILIAGALAAVVLILIKKTKDTPDTAKDPTAKSAGSKEPAAEKPTEPSANK